MDVFVIPIGPHRYELYSEQPATEREAGEPERTGLLARMARRFKGIVQAAEERQRTGQAAPEPQGWTGRLRERALAWAVERIAEQRLLWNLRGLDAAVAVHPDDMTFDQVLTLIRRTLQHDYDRHRRWLIIDGILFVVTFVALGPVFLLIPGIANLPALYFWFRAIGHYLSMRGAGQGLHRVAWSGRPSPPLGELRALTHLEPHNREERLDDISRRLRLEHLARFFDRVAIEHS